MRNGLMTPKSLKTQEPPSTLVDLFAGSAARHANRPAVSDVNTQLTYAELDTRSTDLARTLATLGIGPEDRVALYMERSIEIVVGILGIVKAGAAYLPIDTRYPVARRDFMMIDGGVKVVVTQPGWKSRLSATSFHVLEWNSGSTARSPDGIWPCPATEANAASVLYTSGSTGTPKGIVLEHRQIVSFVTNSGLPALTSEDRVAQLGSVSFDAITLEVWCTLAVGAEIVVLPPITDLLATDFQRELKSRRITAMLMPAAAMNHIVREDRDAFSPLRILLTGGDVILPATCSDLLASSFKGRLFNLYGPTECTTACTAYEVREMPRRVRTVPIGRALAGCSLYVLGPAQNPVPRGSVGELYIGGRGVARGYLGRPGLTAARFIPDPFAGNGTRMYATGDLGRENEQGDLEFLGRVDEQAKIRGYRVEPSEVERVLCQYSEVREAAVIVAGEVSNKQLVAFLVPMCDSISLKGLRRFLLRMVPDYMVPTDFTVIPALPTNPHGKRDRDALVQLWAATVQQRAEYLPARNDIEQYLVSLWEELLATERISVLDDFFSLGGHSLLEVKVWSAVQRDLGVALDFQLLFENSVLQDLAQLIEQARKAVRFHEDCADRPH
jgi:amino acid adenylation domain-containing protein